MKLLDFNKKAQAMRNVMVPIIFLFSFAVVSIIGAVVTIAICNAYKTLFPTNSSIINAANSFINIYNIIDILIFFVMIAFIIGIIVTSYKIRSRTIYFIFTFISSMFLGFLGYIFSYIFSQIASNPALTTVLYIFNLTILVLTNLHWIALIMLLLGAIALYGKGEGGGTPLT